LEALLSVGDLSRVADRLETLSQDRSRVVPSSKEIAESISLMETSEEVADSSNKFRAIVFSVFTG
jgi:hypothetical protein